MRGAAAFAIPVETTTRRPDPSILTQYTRPPRDRYGLHVLLFLLTLASVALTGLQFVARDLLYTEHVWFWLLGLPIGPAATFDGLRFAVPLLLFLTVHEFGHYFAARYHGVSTSLPYYIPSPLLGIGTLGAVIRIREPLPSTRKLFDVGAAGPLAGFVAALAILLYGLATLPGPEYFDTMSGHEWIRSYIAANGAYPAAPPAGTDPLSLGNTLLFALLTALFPNVPPAFELYHYPVVFAGWLGLFFTALNLLPAGQLDGGHIVYALFGPRWHRRLARAAVALMMVSGGVGTITFFAPLLDARMPGLELVTWIGLAAFFALLVARMGRRMPLRRLALVVAGLIAAVALIVALGPAVSKYGAGMWLVWSFLIVRFIRVDHPGVLYPEKLTPMRRALGIACLVLLVLCFSPRPFYGGL